MRKVKIADSLFSPWGKTFWLGRDNSSRTPEHFEWEIVPPEQARFVSQSHIPLTTGENQVAVLLESFFLHPQNYIQALEKPFEHVLTHNAYFAKNNKNWLWFPHGGSWINFDDWRIYEKSKNVSILLSPKKLIRGHQLFHEIVEKYADKFDGIHGLDGYAEKIPSLAPYRFAVIVEAECVDGFFTEKLIDCLSVGTVPIYWGCPNIGDYFDVDGILRASCLDEIGLWLDRVGPVLYNALMDGVKNNFQTAHRYRCAEDWIYEHYPFLFGD